MGQHIKHYGFAVSAAPRYTQQYENDFVARKCTLLQFVLAEA